MFRLTIIKPVAFGMIDQAYSWYENEMPGLGERLLKEIDQSFQKLELAPLAYSLFTKRYR